MNKIENIGKVIFAGAGPGDPELITLKTLRYLETADVIVVDRLVSQDLIERFVSNDIEIIYVGKQNNNKGSAEQGFISQLLVDLALRGKLVVRLKGGDVSVFSNILDELTILSEHRIPFEIIPGITAAIGAAAYSGIPLTARGYSTAVRFLTYYKADVIHEDYWKELASTEDTLVFYMSSERVDEIIEKLIHYKISVEKSLALIEQATTPLQNVHVHNLYEYKKGQSFISPALLIIGRVVELHERFKWIENNVNGEYYFKPISSVTEGTNTLYLKS